MKKKAFLTTLPDFVEIQRASFCWFLEKGLSEELEKFSSITDYYKNLEFNFFGQEYKIRKPLFDFMESKRRNTTYSAKIYLPISISYFNTIIKKRINIFIGELPLMTDAGIFLINGCERVIVNQIIRSPGVYYKEFSTNSYKATIIPHRGSWLNFEINKNQQINVYIDKMENINITDFLNVCDISLNEILSNFKYPEFILKQIQPNLIKKSNYEQIELKKLLDKHIFNTKYYTLGKIGRYKLNQRFNLNVPTHIYEITRQDIIAIIVNLIHLRQMDGNIEYQFGNYDDIDHLQNRRVRSVGELLQLQFRSGLTRLDRIILEKLSVANLNLIKIKHLVTPKPLISIMREFFGSSQLSQFLNQTNPLAALTHRRRISGFGIGGFNKDHVSFAVRDIHSSHYGRICPIETPEGQNAGLVSSLAVYSRVNSFGFLETPFFKVKHGIVLKNYPAIYLTADEEENLKVAPADTELEEKGKIKKDFITIRYKQEFLIINSLEVQLISVSPIQMISSATALIPFLEHDDANRVLMGSNMQRQAVPLLFPTKAIIGTGLENQLASDAGVAVISHFNGKVIAVSNNYIKIKNNTGTTTVYTLLKYIRSNQDTWIHQRSIVWIGEHIEAGQIIADGPGIENGEMALGQNLLVAYMPWEGYNYEDALLINERLVSDDLFTSIHIETYDLEISETIEGIENLTNDLPNVDYLLTKNLDKNGLIRIGTFVHSGDILVGKTTPQEIEEKPYKKLLNAIFETKIPFEIDNSLKVPNRSYGRVIDVRIFSPENGDELALSTNFSVRVFLAQIRKIQVGDKLSGRHGNKGIISCILGREDMPYLPNGKSIDLILNPLGVPSRMNVGQLFEGLFGFAGDILDQRYKVMPFDEMFGMDASRILVNKFLKKAKYSSKIPWVYSNFSPGKIYLRDGRTGQLFDNPITICKSYILKLIHLVDDKIHARSVGPYSLITQQPLGGRSKNGGQRFGEMEVWALEAFGAAYTLQEILTYKSDDIEGRNQIFISIIKNKKMPKPSIPESFKVLILELKALGLDISLHKINKKINGESHDFEIDIMKKSNVLPNYQSIEIF